MVQKLDPLCLIPFEGPKIRTAPPGYNWYRHCTFQYHNGAKLVPIPGRVQVRYRHKRTDILTLDDQGAAVQGFDLAWLVRQAGFEPAPGTNAIPINP